MTSSHPTLGALSGASVVRALLDRWERWQGRLVWAGVAYLVIAAAGRLIYAFPYLLADKAGWSAIDFKYRYAEVQLWFAGAPVYGALDRLTYPPASYAVLWPFLGWLPLSEARLLWAVTSMAAAALIAWVAYRVTERYPLRERLVIALLAFAAYPVQMSVLVGQLPTHVVALAAVAAWLVVRERPSLGTDLAGGVLLAASLVKPTLSLPIVAATLVAARRWRPALLAGGSYAGLALIGAAAQPRNVVAQHFAWLASTTAPGLDGELAQGMPNLHQLVAKLGFEDWAPHVSLVVLAAFTAWCWRHRRAEPWVLIGAGAMVARLWTYHREYDDVIVLLTAIALIRVARSAYESLRPAGALLFAATWAAMLTPTWAFYQLPANAVHVIQFSQVMLWLVVLAFLLLRAGRALPAAAERTGAHVPGGAVPGEAR